MKKFLSISLATIISLQEIIHITYAKRGDKLSCVIEEAYNLDISNE